MGRRILLNIMITIVVFFFMSVPSPVRADCTGSVSDCTGAHANTNTTNQSKTPIQSKSGVSNHGTLGSYFKILFALIFVLLLIYGLYRFVSKKTKSFQEYGAIKNIGGVAVGPNRSVQLVRVGEDILVVGVGENVQLIKEIKDPDVIHDLIQQPNKDIQTLSPIWRKWVKKIKESTINKVTSKPSFKTILTDKLQSMSDERKKTYEAIKKQEDHNK